MKIIYRYLLGILLITLCYSCKKVQQLDSAPFVQRAADLQQRVKANLHGQTWVFPFKSGLDTSKVRVPILMTFDTLKNEVTMSSIYGNAVTSSFSVSTAFGVPSINFNTASPISYLYMSTAFPSPNVTDFVFKVIDIKDDQMTLQSYRDYVANKPEGAGIPVKLTKASTLPWVKEWQDGDKNLNNYPQFFVKSSPRKLNLTVSLKIAGDANPKTFQMMMTKKPEPDFLDMILMEGVNYLFGFKGMAPVSVRTRTTSPLTGTFVANNSLFMSYITSNARVNYWVDPLQTSYFMFKTINSNSIDVFTIDADCNKFSEGTITIVP